MYNLQPQLHLQVLANKWIVGALPQTVAALVYIQALHSYLCILFPHMFRFVSKFVTAFHHLELHFLIL